MSRVLVDTSVWIDFLRTDDFQLQQLLENNRVCMHSMIVGALACGHLHQRVELIKLWNHLPGMIEASHEETLFFLEHNHLMGHGIGYIDLQLLADVSLSPDSRLWTREKGLHKVAVGLKRAFL